MKWKKNIQMEREIKKEIVTEIDASKGKNWQDTGQKEQKKSKEAKDWKDRKDSRMTLWQ